MPVVPGTEEFVVGVNVPGEDALRYLGIEDGYCVAGGLGQARRVDRPTAERWIGYIERQSEAEGITKFPVCLCAADGWPVLEPITIELAVLNLEGAAA